MAIKVNDKQKYMETRAAIATEAGKPLSIETVTLEGPRDGEVLVEGKSTGICHTDAYTLSGADPEGLFSVILGHEGAGIVVDCGPGVTTLKKAITLFRIAYQNANNAKHVCRETRTFAPLPGRHRGNASCPAGTVVSQSAVTNPSTIWAPRPFQNIPSSQKLPSQRFEKTHLSTKFTTLVAA